MPPIKNMYINVSLL